MYCYYCGEYINENKINHFVTNKDVLEMEIRNLKYELSKIKEEVAEYEKNYNKKIKEVNEEEKAVLDAELEAFIVETKEKLDVINTELTEKELNRNSLDASPHYLDKANCDTKSSFVCPRCGHLVHEGYDEKDLKSLSSASHAELQRGRNDFARGMSCVSISVILAITSFIFLLLSRKADIQYQISLTCPEFWVFLVLAIISVILIVIGAYLVVRGVKRKIRYTKLLKDINTKTFVQ